MLRKLRRKGLLNSPIIQSDFNQCKKLYCYTTGYKKEATLATSTKLKQPPKSVQLAFTLQKRQYMDQLYLTVRKLYPRGLSLSEVALQYVSQHINYGRKVYISMSNTGRLIYTLSWHPNDT